MYHRPKTSSIQVVFKKKYQQVTILVTFLDREEQLREGGGERCHPYPCVYLLIDPLSIQIIVSSSINSVTGELDRILFPVLHYKSFNHSKNTKSQFLHSSG